MPSPKFYIVGFVGLLLYFTCFRESVSCGWEAMFLALNVGILQLTRTNFSNWLWRVETFLDKEGVKDAIDLSNTGKGKLTAKEEQQLKEHDKKARWIITQCLSDKHLEIVKVAEPAKEMMQSLKNVIVCQSPVSKLLMRKKLLKLKFQGGELHDHFLEVETLLRELESFGSNPG
ncbi:hypothetical protein PR048_015436 [Dryococelus australis]|uniref:Uncharacterized protein n=1 Tax=Dryococelus australis TaxID=614101 RepID=A0ABQ9HGZ3_9NEOP|nr:hypothetical protein PR048_015436 [Dryococelus australis]